MSLVGHRFLINVIQKNKNTDKNTRQDLSLMQNINDVDCLYNLVERKIKSCRKPSKKFLEFKKKLGLDSDVVTCDKQNIIKCIANCIWRRNYL